MKQGIQTEMRLYNQNIYEYGCYVLSLLQGANPHKDFTPDELIKMFDYLYEQGFIKRDCTVLDPVSIFNANLNHDVINKAPTRVKIVRDNKGKDVLYYECEPICVVLQCTNEKNNFTHFVLGDSQGNKVWDPLDPERAAALNYHVTGYRLLY